jgi:Uma2 family endonuclease
MATVRSTILPYPKASPAWEIAELFPDQGHLDEDDYLRLTDSSRRLVEFTDGRIEVLPMPTEEHQAIVFFLMTILKAFVVDKKLGWAVSAPFRVRIADRRFREPDITFLSEKSSSLRDNRFWSGADLVVEVVSDDNRRRDLVEKRRDYAAAGIPEYWIVDPRDQSIKVLQLKRGKYVVHSEAKRAGEVRSALLKGFTADVAAVFAAGKNG